MKGLIGMAAISSLLFCCSCNNGPASSEETPKQETAGVKPKVKLREEQVSYQAGGVNMKGFVTYDENLQGARPAVLVVHEWWGLNDYPKNRARQLAEMGYIAMAVDMYGDGKTAADPKQAQALAMPFYNSPQLAKVRLEAALARIKQYTQTDTGKIAAIGYCYGGYVVLNAAKLGTDLKGVVSYHGSLAGVRPAKKLLKARVLVCHGEADTFESPEEISTFRRQMDSIGANYSFKTYPNATHAFTNPEATVNGKNFNMPIAYNAEADKASWKDMTAFFDNLFHTTP